MSKPDHPSPSDGVAWGARLLRQALPSDHPDLDYLVMARAAAVTALSMFPPSMTVADALDVLDGLSLPEVTP